MLNNFPLLSKTLSFSNILLILIDISLPGISLVVLLDANSHILSIYFFVNFDLFLLPNYWVFVYNI